MKTRNHCPHTRSHPSDDRFTDGIATLLCEIAVVAGAVLVSVALMALAYGASA